MKVKKCLKCNTEYSQDQNACPECGEIGFKLVGDELQETPAELAKVGSFWMGFLVGLNPFGGLFVAMAFGQRRTLIGGICAFVLRMILLVLIIVGIVALVKHYR